MKRSFTMILPAIILLCVLIQGCAPVFSELQSARMAGEGNIEVTPSYSTVGFREDGEGAGVQNHFGFQLAYGISQSVDLRLRYEYLWLKEDGDFSDGISVLGLGPKFRLVENRLAFFLPLGRAFGQGSSDTWQLHPTFLITLPAVENKVDFTLSPKFLFAFCSGCENLMAINLGSSFSSDLSRWAVRPEYGFLFNPGEPGSFRHFSIGFSAFIGK